MSGLDLDATIRRSIATLLHASYTDHEPTETTDVWRTIAADARRDLDALITRLRAAEARLAWQPIETAPRVLDYILTHGPRGHVVARYCASLGWVDAEDVDVYFTHWQPLPAPPASEVSRG